MEAKDSKKTIRQIRQRQDHDHTFELLLAIFRKVTGTKYWNGDPVEYCDMYKQEIEALGSVLKYVGYAKPSKRCSIGWLPAKELWKCMAEKTMHSQEEIIRDDTDYIDLMIEWIIDVGDKCKRRRAIKFCAEAMVQFGLIYEDETPVWRMCPDLVDRFSTIRWVEETESLAGS
jgi:hypothetical protein